MKKVPYILIAIGIFFLIRNFNIFDGFDFIDKIMSRLSRELGDYWPFILIFVGIYLLFAIKRR